MNTTDLLLAALGLLAVFALWRLIVGPSFQDRMLALTSVSALVVIMLATLGLRSGEAYYLDIAMVYAILSFGEVAAFVWIRKRRGGV